MVTAANEMSSAIQEVARSTSNAATGAEQTSGASAELARLATRLQDAVGQFKV